MPDDYGNLRPISVPLIPWLQTFRHGEHVRVAAGELTGRSGTVSRVDHATYTREPVVWVLLDHDEHDPSPFRPGELRPAGSSRENQNRDKRPPAA